jgi:hypothetical protein
MVGTFTGSLVIVVNILLTRLGANALIGCIGCFKRKKDVEKQFIWLRNKWRLCGGQLKITVGLLGI